MRIRAELEFYHDKSHQMRNAKCEMRNAPSFERPYFYRLLDGRWVKVQLPSGFTILALINTQS